MNKATIYDLASRGLSSDEIETKDAILRTIIGLMLSRNIDNEYSKSVEQLLKLTAQRRDGYVKLTDLEIKDAKNKYGTYNKYAKLQLALDFFQMSNDLFFAIYGFNYVPEGKVRDAARKLIDSQMMLNNIAAPYMNVNVSPSLSEIGQNMNVNMVQPLSMDKMVKRFLERGC